MSVFLHIPENIAAIVPQYTSQGDATTIITTDGITHMSRFRIRTVMRQLARTQAIDLAMLKKQTPAFTRSSILQPLPLRPGLILCPLKIRTPLIKGDPTTGYINFFAVTKILANGSHPYHAEIHLKGDTRLPCMWSKSVIEKRLQHCSIIKNMLSRSHPTNILREHASEYTTEITCLIERFILKIEQLIDYKLGR